MSRYKEFDQYEELLKGRLSKKRFTHTMNVAEACYDLAERFGGDKKRCYLAGMLHDIMKEELPERQKQMTAESGFQPDSAEIDTPALRHAVAGAAYVRDQLGIDDEEILAGIRFHTIGCAKMTLLEKIIYLADYIEPTRDFPGVETLRRTVYEDLDRGLLMGLTMTIDEMEEMGNPVHHMTRDARDYLMKRGIS